MKNERLEKGYMTSDISLASAMLCSDGASLEGIGGAGKEKVFKIAGDPDKLEAIKKSWFGEKPVMIDVKQFASKRKNLLGSLALLPKE